ncbi:hypothetical protein BJP36_00465 [Moorena producens JHB]|uniref:Uncharacterized protein n=1 Tax=Moorena producens (strain JHB) TaxID=1454205 RepID=A0A1D9FT79_MOOP1|nr:hypothetical protein [Moorena producens]AOY78581.1 hypothetical protein BJP36_00465 [Moorena producens JHB]
MIISDLNHLETIAEDPKVVGGSRYYPPHYNSFVYNGYINVGANIQGHVARVDGDARAFGKNTFTSINGTTTTTDYSSHSSLNATSASSSY